MVNVVLVQQNASPEVVKVLAGNKCEVTNQQRAVDKERGLKVGMSLFQAGVLVQIYVSGAFVKTCIAVKVTAGRLLVITAVKYFLNTVHYCVVWHIFSTM